MKLSETCSGICEDTRKKSRVSFFFSFFLYSSLFLVTPADFYRVAQTCVSRGQHRALIDIDTCSDKLILGLRVA